MTSRREWLSMLVGMTALSGQQRGTPKGVMIVRSPSPEDLEMPLNRFGDWITPIDTFFVRSHHYTPKVDVAAWKLSLTGLVDAPYSLTLEELRKMPRVELVSVLECAGNGRGLFEPSMPGVQWAYGAVGNGRWAGVRLADVMSRAKLKSSAAHLLFRGADEPVGKQPKFERSVPLKRALGSNTILAYEMNGQPLPMSHGAPLRLVIPGWAGDSWVKWVTEIRAIEQEFDGFYMKTAYRHPGRPVEPGLAVPPEQMKPVESLTIKSVITSPIAGTFVKPGSVRIAGVAWSGEHPVAGVDVSTDNGRTWQKAVLGKESAPFAWRLWEYTWRTPQVAYYTLMARARDSAGNVQPLAQEWNPSGYLNNEVHSVGVEVSTAEPKPEPAAGPEASKVPEQFQQPPGYKTACLSCHDEHLTLQQRLSRIQWEAEVGKMMRWGAPVDPANHKAIVEYLLRLYGPRPRP